MEQTKEGAFKLYNIRYLPLFAAFFILGIFCVKLSYATAAIIGGVAILCSLALLFTKSIKRPVAIALIVVVLFGYGIATLELHLRNDVGLSGEVQVTCRITDVTELADGSYSVVADRVRQGAKSYDGGLTFRTEENLSVGDRLTINGEIEIREVSLQNVFSAIEYRKGAKYEITPETLIAEEGSPPLSYAIKEEVRAVLVQYEGERAGGFSYAMIFGDTEYMERADKSAMRAVGVAHVFAVSGLHIGVLAAALIFLLKKMRVKAKALPFVVFPFFAFYAYLVGFTPSVLRASVMVLVGLAASTLGERYDDLSAISLAAILILLVRPLYLFDVSFIMSFLAIFGIACLAKPLEKAFLKRKMKAPLASGLALSVAVSIALVPVSAVVFGEVSLIGFVLNILVVPLASVAYILTLISLLLTTLSPAFGALLSTVAYLPLFIIELSLRAAELGLVASYDFSAAEILLYYAILFFVGKYSLAKRKVKFVVGGTGLGALAILLFVL